MDRLSVFLSAAIAVALFQTRLQVDACSCQPMHPQHLYCSSDFVIKALVSTRRVVELYSDGSYRRLTKHHPDIEEDDIEISGSFEEPREKGPETGELPILEEVEAIRPAPLQSHPRGPLGPNSRMPGYIRGLAVVPKIREVYAPGYSSSVRRKRDVPRVSRINRRRGFRRGPGIAPGRLSEFIGDEGMPVKRVMLQYRINIIKIFKGLKNFTKSQLEFVYTPPPPLCSVELHTDHSPFILMGSVQEGSLVIKQCDYRVDMMKLSKEERSNVVRNMEHRYPKECDRCHTRVCLRDACDDEQPFTCTWKEWWSASSLWSSQFACIHAKNGKCKWYCPLPQGGKPEDVDDWRR